MVASTRTSKRAPEPFTKGDLFASWWYGVKVRARKRIQEYIRKFQMVSTIILWSFVLGYALAKGWIF